MSRKTCAPLMPDASRLLADIRRAYRFAARTAHLMVGLPDYATYTDHRRTHHPDEPVMSREQFFRQCQDRRYAPSGGRGIRCC